MKQFLESKWGDKALNGLVTLVIVALGALYSRGEISGKTSQWIVDQFKVQGDAIAAVKGELDCTKTDVKDIRVELTNHEREQAASEAENKVKIEAIEELTGQVKILSAQVTKLQIELARFPMKSYGAGELKTETEKR